MTRPAVRPTVLIFVRYYLPGYKSGGPIRAIANMVDHLGNEFEFRIVTSDRDALDDPPYPHVAVNAWNPVGNVQVYYAGPRSLTLKTLTTVLKETPHDVLYMNSFFDPVFTGRPLLARRLGWLPEKPVVLAPRGEFSEGALALKQWKKRAFLAMTRAMGLFAGLTWQASSEHEAADIRRAMGPAVGRIHLAADLPPAIIPQVSHPRAARDQDAPLRVVFLSRITPMKNLDFALRVLQRVSVLVELNIYGPVRDEEYWTYCKALVKDLPGNVQAVHHGSVAHAEVATIMAAHDLFFLPTRGENYGHVIPEALAVGTPVLIANTTPWRGLERAGLGWDLPLDDMQSFVERIEACSRLGGEEYSAWRERVSVACRARLADPAVIAANRDLFMNMANAGA